MAFAKAVSTPLAQKRGLQEAIGSPIDASLYRRIGGSLQYLTLTRTDISHAVNLASQFMQAPNSEHFHTVKRILIYIKGTVQYRLRMLSKSPFRIYDFSDANWGNCTKTRRSTTGYYLSFFK
ncbi:hypothetical protein RND71_014370 [Anisodus tanguticus]|uniref:Mitochondrial protein n=1 Tax=Anisodus tanguticus TaxID=243964 RepID=A0AAE1VNK9_9SOLA|nr:hypothetical protein RND71_014370 [Anisodus tanguticus]